MAAAATTATATSAKWKQGDAVTIVSRTATPQDAKSGLYFAHYAGLRGTILKIYGEEAAIQVETNSLPDDIRARHTEGENALRSKWLDNLSESARGGLTDKEKNFRLNYAVLVSVQDLQPAAPGETKAVAPIPAAVKEQAKAVGKAARAVDPLSGASDVGEADQRTADDDGAFEGGTDSAVKRASAADLDAAEARFLAQRKGR